MQCLWSISRQLVAAEDLALASLHLDLPALMSTLSMLSYRYGLERSCYCTGWVVRCDSHLCTLMLPGAIRNAAKSTSTAVGCGCHALQLPPRHVLPPLPERTAAPAQAEEEVDVFGDSGDDASDSASSSDAETDAEDCSQGTIAEEASRSRQSA